MKRKYKIFLWLIVYFIIFAIGLFVYFSFFKTKDVVEQPPVNEIKITNSIDEYGYHLEDRDSELYKEKFEALKVLLEEENYSKDEYIKLVSELFIIDLYTIDNKISRYDIGGLDFVYQEAQESFRTVIQNSIYKTVENNLDDTRTQSLPVVSSIEVDSISEITYTMPDESNVDGYRVSLNWTYETSLGYDDSAVLILIPENNKMSVVFYKPAK